MKAKVNPVYIILLLILNLINISLLGCEMTTPKGQIEQNKNVLNVPFKYYFNEILFQANVKNSKSLWFILDTGASDLVINENTAKDLELPFGDVIDQGYSAIGEERVYETIVSKVTLKIKDSENYFSEDVFAGSLKLIETVMGHHIDGVAGRHLFEKYVIEIDYGKKIFNMYDPNNWQYQGNGKVIPIYIDGVPYVKATITLPDNKKVEGYFLIDTGTAGAIYFTSKFSNENNLSEVMGNTLASIQVGGGGKSENRVGRVKAISIGGYKINNPIVALSNDTKGGMARTDIAGIIGNEILKKFKVIFDYTNEQMILETSDSSYDQMEWDMSGLFLYTSGENYDQVNVYKVLPNSPADNAGIQAGDKIISIDEKDTGSYSIDEIIKMFKLDGKQYNIVILRNNRKIEVKIKLRKLI